MNMTMTLSFRSIRGVLLVLSLCATGVVSAQSERITIRLMPQPNQVVRFHTVQEVRFALPSPGTPANTTSPSSGAVAATIDAVHTLSVGAPDSQGHAEAQFAFEQFMMSMSLNGQPMPLPLPMDSILRHLFTATLDRDGRIIDVKGADESAGIIATIKPMLTGALNGPPSVTLAPGETATVPLSAELALPLPGNANPMGLTGEMKYTLVSVEAGSAGRVAHLTTTFTGHVVGQDIPTPAGMLSMEMAMTGDGTLDVNTDRGIVSLRKQRQAIDIQIQPGAGAAVPIPPMKMSGTITLTVSAE
jgi:hypothetical protein